MQSPPKFNFKLLGRFKTCLERQISEALAIENMNCDHIMNAKAEWGRNLIPRLKNMPEEEFSTSFKPDSAKQAANKRTHEGFTVHPPDAHHEEDQHRQDTFQSQYKQRKRARLERNKQALSDGNDQINDDTYCKEYRPRKHPTRASVSDSKSVILDVNMIAKPGIFDM